MWAYIIDNVTNNKIQNNVKLKYAITSMNNISTYNRNSYNSNVNISNDIILIQYPFLKIILIQNQ